MITIFNKNVGAGRIIGIADDGLRIIILDQDTAD